jgi:threonyl-tRNA synthetase
LPLWLSPIQAIVLPISEKFADYAGKVLDRLKSEGIRAEADCRSEKIGYKIREARNGRVPYILVVGEQEENSGTVSVRRGDNDEGAAELGVLIERMRKEVKEKRYADEK